ncbi:uncharacterized protein SCHCODRAFT_02626545 [Schizophyllum commune H4-8]|uniref:Pesticidal crystal protein cry6Aa n=1 Tax=Schizophyllum commune (strain H4-8 / FGSC 9210) TaxID=578458 RepID=D8Q4J7_SCHCM|nr:uncharacterized protein SCHCODRAFT_02626545 [Schizophyllum commune H4-8]KAI5892588.1 hypothetical protein SCHCODRAFT_02626545 [Schizophyllum commune H4-8]
MSSDTPTIDMTPQGLLNADGNYVLQQEDVYNLLKYVWAGVLLPVTPDDYQKRLQISTDIATKLSNVITPLVAAYKTCSANCTTFKTTTYPSIVAIASDIYSYAQNAGGTAQDSYYANIWQGIRSLANATSPTQAQQLTDTINGLIDVQVTDIANIKAKAEQVVTDLTTFKTQTEGDQTTLKTNLDAVAAALKAEDGDLATLEKLLVDNKAELASDEEEYEHDVIVACTTLTYVWVPLWGTISAIVVAGVFGKKAADMADKIDEMKKLITDEEGKISDEKRLLADLNAVDTDLTNFYASIDPAVTALKDMITVWDNISAQLTNLKSIVANDVKKANAVTAAQTDAILVAKWNTLKEAVDKYRKAAYITPIQQSSLDAISAQLRQQASRAA